LLIRKVGGPAGPGHEAKRLAGFTLRRL